MSYKTLHARRRVAARRLLVLALLGSPVIPAVGTECVGHRVNAGEELENSMSALESAFRMGLPNVEIDIRHTRDGIAILSHDAKLNRVATDAPGAQCPARSNISELTADEILHSCRMTNGDEVATLEYVVTRLESESTRLFLELKDVPNEATLELVKRIYAGREDAIRVISKDSEALTVARDFLGRNYRFLHIHRNFRKLDLEFDGVLNRRADASQLSELNASGFLTGTYTINDPTDMRRYSDAGVSYVVSDFPALCVQTLAGE
jgi:glycerophosphoryl diester phosphodiesterase